MHRISLLGVVLWTLCIAVACGQSAPAEKTSPSTPGPLAESDKPQAQTQSELHRTLERTAADFATGMVPMGRTLQGVLKQGEFRDHGFTLPAAGCYKFVATGGRGLLDLDLLLLDYQNTPVQRDLGQDNIPVLGMAAPICPERTQNHRVRVTAHSGQGKYLLQAYRSTL